MRMGVRSRHAWALAGLAMVAASAAAIRPAEGPDSGPKLGEVVDAFDIYDVTGPNKGRELCYR